MQSNSRGAVRQLARIAEALAAIGLVAMTLTIAWQVFGRYVLNASPVWSESAALLLMLWFVLLAAAVGVYEQFHLGFRFLISALSHAWRKLVYMAGQALVGGFGIAMAANGGKLVEFTLGHEIPTLGISRAVVYWPFVLGGTLIAVFAVSRIVLAFRMQQDQSLWN